jgi:hypothetical protein
VLRAVSSSRTHGPFRLLQGYAALANDGNTDGNFADGSVSHTMLETRPWWEVDLGCVASVDHVVI